MRYIVSIRHAMIMINDSHVDLEIHIQNITYSSLIEPNSNKQVFGKNNQDSP